MSIRGFASLLDDRVALAAAIRREYALPPDEYAPGRMKFLRSMLGRKRIFHTHHFRNRLEQTARGNMRRELAGLGRQME